MHEIALYRRADDRALRPSLTHSGAQSVPLQAHPAKRALGPNRAADMVALRPRCPHHRTLHTTFLLQFPVVDLDLPCRIRRHTVP